MLCLLSKHDFIRPHYVAAHDARAHHCTAGLTGLEPGDRPVSRRRKNVKTAPDHYATVASPNLARWTSGNRAAPVGALRILMPVALTLLPSLSTSRQAAGSQAPATSTVLPTPDPRRHSAVCCCRFCEQRGTGEQAMRSVGGDYQRFLARLAGR